MVMITIVFSWVYHEGPTLGNSIGAKPSTDGRSILNLIHLLVKWGNRLVSGLNYSECDFDAIDRIQNLVDDDCVTMGGI